MNELTTLTSIYKSKNYLKGFLKNCSQQTMENFNLHIEMICPSRFEENLIKKYQKKMKNLQFSKHNNQINLPEAWNNTIKHNDSKYFCIWNVDDLRTKFSLEVMYTTLETNKNIDFVYGNYFIVDKFKKTKGNFINESNREKELTKSMILGPFFMFRASVLKKIGHFDEQLYSGADYDFAIRLGKNFKGKHINSNLGYYLDSGKGLSTRPNSLQELERTVVELRYGLKPLNNNLVDEAAKKYNLNKIKEFSNFVDLAT